MSDDILQTIREYYTKGEVSDSYKSNNYTTHDFSIGDEVVCISSKSSSSNNLKVGETYTITDFGIMDVEDKGVKKEYLQLKEIKGAFPDPASFRKPEWFNEGVEV